MKQLTLAVKTQAGLTLLEVLIAAIICVIGLMGTMLLDLRMLQNSQSSYYYAVATLEANNLVDRPWANLCAVATDAVVYDQTVLAWQNTLASKAWAPVAVPADFTLHPDITIGWSDDKVAASEQIAGHNQLTLQANFPNVCP